jgi:ribosomal protein L7/L12
MKTADPTKQVTIRFRDDIVKEATRLAVLADKPIRPEVVISPQVAIEILHIVEEAKNFEATGALRHALALAIQIQQSKPEDLAAAIIEQYPDTGRIPQIKTLERLTGLKLSETKPLIDKALAARPKTPVDPFDL